MLHRISSQPQISNLSKCRYSLEEHYASSLFCHVLPFSGSLHGLAPLTPNGWSLCYDRCGRYCTHKIEKDKATDSNVLWHYTPCTQPLMILGYNGSRSNKTKILASQFIQHSKGLQDTQIRFQETLRDSRGVPFLVSRIWYFFYFERALPLLTGEHYSWHEATLFLL